MNNRPFFRRIAVPILAAALSGALYSEVNAQNLSEGLVSYWPLDVVVGGKTPDLVNGYDLSPYIGALIRLERRKHCAGAGNSEQCCELCRGESNFAGLSGRSQ